MSIIAIFKNTERFSKTNMPKPGQECFYCPGHWLVPDVFIPEYKTCVKPYIRPFAICKVLEQNKKMHLVSVRFGTQEETDVVSPDFLLPVVLSDAGKEMGLKI